MEAIYIKVGNSVRIINKPTTGADNQLTPDEKIMVNLYEENKKLRFMIEKGLGWDDMINDIQLPHEI